MNKKSIIENIVDSESYKKWIQHKIDEIERTRGECSSIPGDILRNELITYQLALAVMNNKPVAWTDVEELEEMNHDGYGAMMSVGNVSPAADIRRQIFLYTHPALLIYEIYR